MADTPGGEGDGQAVGSIYASIRVDTNNLNSDMDGARRAMDLANTSAEKLAATGQKVEASFATMGAASTAAATQQAQDSERALQAALKAMNQRSQAAEKTALAESQAGLKAGQDAIGSFLVAEGASRKAADSEVYDSDRSLQAALRAMNQRGDAATKTALAESQAGLKAGQDAIGSFLVIEGASRKAADSEVYDTERALQAALKAMDERTRAANALAAAESRAGLKAGQGDIGSYLVTERQARAAEEAAAASAKQAAQVQAVTTAFASYAVSGEHAATATRLMAEAQAQNRTAAASALASYAGLAPVVDATTAAWARNRVGMGQTDAQMARTAAAATREYEAINKGLIGTGYASSAAAGGMGKASKGSMDLGRSVLYASQGIEDLQYGLGAVLNNIPILTMAMGGSAGLAGTISIVAVGAAVLVRHWNDLANKFGAGHTLSEAEEMKELAKQTNLAATEQARLNKFKEEEADFAENMKAKSKAEQEGSKAIKEIIAEGGGAKLIEKLALGRAANGTEFTDAEKKEMVDNQHLREGKGGLQHGMGRFAAMGRFIAGPLGITETNAQAADRRDQEISVEAQNRAVKKASASFTEAGNDPARLAALVKELEGIAAAGKVKFDRHDLDNLRSLSETGESADARDQKDQKENERRAKETREKARQKAKHDKDEAERKAKQEKEATEALKIRVGSQELRDKQEMERNQKQNDDKTAKEAEWARREVMTPRQREREDKQRAREILRNQKLPVGVPLGDAGPVNRNLDFMGDMNARVAGRGRGDQGAASDPKIVALLEKMVEQGDKTIEKLGDLGEGGIPGFYS